LNSPPPKQGPSGGQFVLLAVLVAILIVTVVWATTVWTSSNDVPMSKHGWIALPANGGLSAGSMDQLSAQRRERLAFALRALDGHIDGASYRVIAEVLFGRKRIPESAWKTHELRSRTIRLVQAGLALMRGGYRALLRPPSRKD
jgi:hypothetical protein